MIKVVISHFSKFFKNFFCGVLDSLDIVLSENITSFAQILCFNRAKCF